MAVIKAEISPGPALTLAALPFKNLLYINKFYLKHWTIHVKKWSSLLESATHSHIFKNLKTGTFWAFGVAPGYIGAAPNSTGAAPGSTGR